MRFGHLRISFSKLLNNFFYKFIRVVEKLILNQFLFHGNGKLKQFFDLNYGIFQQLYSFFRD
ncbi:hypothetical protein LEP1GSC059_0757 [Leptospira noguchii serovar Panama str. CZ214]|uniref:Uncharacterized protein n=1 Tax=Leptospira noguchii serovar Panama str. CZ214 TaxID=1001595 RepID=T0GYL5_9LEPT|nr:hypothetical protein LEP1GSC059_0757 [Leptospira noguchii serovar Panama str. CZ214]